MAVDAGFAFALQIDVALHPGVEVMRRERNVVFPLARFDAAQAADAFRGIDAERPAVFRPVVIRRGKRLFSSRGFALCDHLADDTRGSGGQRGAADPAQKQAPCAQCTDGFPFFHFSCLVTSRSAFQQIFQEERTRESAHSTPRS